MRQTRATHRHIHTQREWDQMHTNAPATPKPSTRMWASMRYNYTKNQKPFTSSVHTTQRQIHTWMYACMCSCSWNDEKKRSNWEMTATMTATNRTTKHENEKLLKHTANAAHTKRTENALYREMECWLRHTASIFESSFACVVVLVYVVCTTQNKYTHRVFEIVKRRKKTTQFSMCFFFSCYFFSLEIRTYRNRCCSAVC